MIGCLWTRIHKQPIIALYFEFETVLKFYNLGGLNIRLHKLHRHVSASSQSLRFILSLRLYSCFITSGPEYKVTQVALVVH